MQHSDKKNILIILIKIILFGIIFIIINMKLSSELEPLTHKSHAMWERYFAKTNVNTIVVGTSVAEMIDSRLLDEDTSSNSVNMATPSQYLATSLNAVTFAAEQNPLDTVVLLMGFDCLERDEDLTSTISLEKALYYGAPKKIKYYDFVLNNLKYSLEPRNIGTTDSINKWLSWPVNSSRNIAQLKTNHDEELYNPIINLFVLDNPPVLTNKPYQRVDRNVTNELFELSDDDQKYINQITSIDISKNSLDLLEQLTYYCNNNGIKFVTVVAPHRSDYASKFNGEYDLINEFLKDFIESRSGIYLNLDNDPNLDNILTDNHFTDVEHVDAEGIQIASHILADYLNNLK